MKVDKKNGCDEVNVKTFSENHNKHKITIETYGQPNPESRAIFRARLTRYELKAVCDFITKNFTNDGKK